MLKAVQFIKIISVELLIYPQLKVALVLSVIKQQKKQQQQKSQGCEQCEKTFVFLSLSLCLLLLLHVALICCDWGVNTVFFSLSQGLIGEKYGSIRVPGEVESAEFEMILDAAVEAGLDTRILEEWYCRDENSVPPAYYLKPKAEMLKNYQNSVSRAGRYKEKRACI